MPLQDVEKVSPFLLENCLPFCLKDVMINKINYFGGNTMAKNPSKFTIDYKPKEEKIKNAKVLSFGEIIEAYKEVYKEKELSAENLHNFISEEFSALERAHQTKLITKEDAEREISEDEKAKERVELAQERQNAYENDKNNKPRENTVGFASDYFAVEKEYVNTHEKEYREYQNEINKIKDIEESERTIKEKELNEKYKDSIALHEKWVNLNEKMEKYQGTLEFLNGMPVDSLGKIIDTKSKCDNKEEDFSEKFEKTFADMVSQPDYKPQKDSEGKTINNHQISIGDNTEVVTHTIHNVGGSDLQLTFTGGKFSIAWFDDNMTQDQLNSFALYCYRCGITIDNFGDLAVKKVVDQDKNELGEIKDLFEKATKEYEKGDVNGNTVTAQFITNDPDEELFNKDTKESEKSDNNDINNPPVSPTNADTNQPTSQEVDVPINGSYFGEFIPKNPDLKPFNIQTVRDSTQKILPLGAITSESFGFGTTTISVYPDKDAPDEDGKIDNKKYNVKHTKSYAITFDHRKNTATFYFGPKGKPDAGVFRIALDQAKAQGFKYFEYPSVKDKEGFGAALNGELLKASVKTRMPFLLKGPSGRGCDVGAGDIKDMLEMVNKDNGKEFEGKEGEKVEYLMRWHQQLEKYTRDDSKKKAEFSEVMETVKQQANFEHFKSTHKSGLVALINDGVNGKDGEKWDQVDVICAISAYDKILQDIMKGRLGGKRFNPLDASGNDELIKKEFERYRKNERQKVEDKIDEKLEFLTKDDSSRDMRKNAIDSVKRDFLGGDSRGLTKTLKLLEGYGVSINIDFNKIDGNNYDPKNRKTERSPETQRRIDEIKGNSSKKDEKTPTPLVINQSRGGGRT